MHSFSRTLHIIFMKFTFPTENKFCNWKAFSMETESYFGVSAIAEAIGGRSLTTCLECK